MRRAYDLMAEDYDARYRGRRWEIYDHLTLSGIDSILPSRPGSVLDVGGGTGKFAAHVVRKGHRVTLLDPSPKMLATAHRRFEQEGILADATLIEGSADRLPFPDGSFDALVCEGDPLSYCTGTYTKVASEIMRVLKEGAGLYVSCDNRWQSSLALFCASRLEEARLCADEGVSKDPYGLRVHAFAADELEALFLSQGASDVLVSGKVVACNLLPDAQVEKLVQEHGMEPVVSFERRLGSVGGLLGLAGHLVLTGRKNVARTVPARPPAVLEGVQHDVREERHLLGDRFKLVGSRGGHFVIDSKDGQTYELNDTGILILALAGRMKTDIEIVREMRDRFPEVPVSELEGDVAEILADLRTAGILGTTAETSGENSDFRHSNE